MFTHTGAYTDQAQYSYYTNTATLITDYYVDPVSGNDSHSGLTPALAWATLTHASAKVNPGCTIHCAAGTITNSANTTKACGTPTQRVVYQGAAGYASKLVSTGGNATTAWENDGAYNDIVGFDVTGNGQIGINLGGTGVSVKYCKIHDIPCTSSVGGGGVVAGYTTATALTDADIIGNLIYNIGYNDTGTNGEYIQGIYHARLRGHVENNIVCNCSGYGIQLWHAATNISILHNLCADNGFGGIVVGSGDAPGGVTCDYCQVSNNICVNNGGRYATSGYGLLEAGTTGTHNVYQNNLLNGNTPVVATGLQYALQNGNKPVGTIYDFPDFVNYLDSGLGDYHMESNSVSIDAGYPLYLVTTDFDGAPRAVGRGWDIGPYEYQGLIYTAYTISINNQSSVQVNTYTRTGFSHTLLPSGAVSSISFTDQNDVSVPHPYPYVSCCLSCAGAFVGVQVFTLQDGSIYPNNNGDYVITYATTSPGVYIENWTFQDAAGNSNQITVVTNVN